MADDAEFPAELRAELRYCLRTFNKNWRGITGDAVVAVLAVLVALTVFALLSSGLLRSPVSSGELLLRMLCLCSACCATYDASSCFWDLPTFNILNQANDCKALE